MNKTKKLSIADIYGKFGIFIILMATIIICAIISPTFLSVNNLMNVIRQNVTIGIIACGAQIVILSGEIDLSAGVNHGICRMLCYDGTCCNRKSGLRTSHRASDRSCCWPD